jgi:hypothetical protein
VLEKISCTEGWPSTLGGEGCEEAKRLDIGNSRRESCKVRLRKLE